MAKRTEKGENWDFSKIWESFSVPNMPGFPQINFENIAASQQRNFDAFATANRMAVEGFQAIAQRNGEILRDCYENSAETAQAYGEPVSPAEGMSRQAEFCKEAFETGMANAGEISGMARATADQAMRVMADRIVEGFAEVTGFVVDDAASDTAKTAK